MAEDAAAHVAQRAKADPGQAVDVRVGEEASEDHHPGDQQCHPKKGIDLGSLSDGGSLHDIRLAELSLECRVADLTDQQEHGAVHRGKADTRKQSEHDALLIGSQIGDEFLQRPPALRKESGEEKSLTVLLVRVRILQLGHESSTLHGEPDG